MNSVLNILFLVEWLSVLLSIISQQINCNNYLAQRVAEAFYGTELGPLRLDETQGAILRIFRGLYHRPSREKNITLYGQLHDHQNCNFFGKKN